MKIQFSAVLFLYFKIFHFRLCQNIFSLSLKYQWCIFYDKHMPYIYHFSYFSFKRNNYIEPNVSCCTITNIYQNYYRLPAVSLWHPCHRCESVGCHRSFCRPLPQWPYDNTVGPWWPWHMLLCWFAWRGSVTFCDKWQLLLKKWQKTNLYIQGVFFNWSYPKISQDLSYPKLRWLVLPLKVL